MYTVVGGVTVDPDDPDARFKDVSWDDNGDVELLREEYMVDSSILSKE